MLLSYHRRLNMISEALELRVKSVRVSHCWCICVVMAMVGWGVDGGGRWYAYGTKPGGGRIVASRVRRDTVMTPDHIAVQVRRSG